MASNPSANAANVTGRPSRRLAIPTIWADHVWVGGWDQWVSGWVELRGPVTHTS